MYTLTIDLTKEQVEMLHANGDKIVLAKPSTAGQTPDVAWLAFNGLPKNVVSWEENYGVYASTSAITNGATLDQLSASPMPATIATVYELDAAGIINGPTKLPGQPGAFGLHNLYENVAPGTPMTVGLFQNATIGAQQVTGNAVSAAPVMQGQTAEMTPYTHVYIWTQAQIVGNSVVTVISGNRTELQFGGDTTDLTVTYDSSTATFNVVSSHSPAAIHHLSERTSHAQKA
ncbi:hypothetical protein GO988_17315 [Hymenobacter sp. HMF4947]|uniref:Uncharacterized protein n=1 Tax=Hymenobacter ginkgonis TaxID=2682976 RepID=A0A7K1TI96_9BACT|nr:hypothetical protein [Hymenobacter ginkgonis]MVN78092.1 hypothetical protein [Hymenobacter ginkgonis]